MLGGGGEFPIVGVPLPPGSPIARREPWKEGQAGDPREAVPNPVHDRCAGASHANQNAVLRVPVGRDGGVSPGRLHRVLIGEGVSRGIVQRGARKLR